VVDDLIRESADPVEASLREGYLVPAPWRHSVEHTAVSRCTSAERANQWRSIQGNKRHNVIESKNFGASFRLLTFRQLTWPSASAAQETEVTGAGVVDEVGAGENSNNPP
jgi:hypothetical protein